MRREAKFEWKDRHEHTFQELKLTYEPVVTILRSEERFVIYSDALYQGLGCVLMQDGRVIAYR